MRLRRPHGRLGLGRRRPAEPRVPAPRRARPAGAADADQPVRDPVALRRRRLREQVAVVRPRARRGARRRTRGRRPAARPRRPRRARPRPHPHERRPLRGRLLQPRALRLVRHADPRRAPAPSSRRGPTAPPRCPPSRASSRCSRSRTAARRSASRSPTRTARSTRTRTSRRARRSLLASIDRDGARPVRAHPRVRARLRARHPAGRALDRLRARSPRAGRSRCTCCRTGTSRTSPRRRMPSATSSHRSTCGCCAASTRSTTPPPPTSRPGIRRPCTPGATRCGCTCELTSPAPRRRQAQVPRRIRGRHGRLDRRHPARDLGRAPARRRGRSIPVNSTEPTPDAAARSLFAD